MQSWIGLYGLLQIIRSADLTEFTGETITTALQGSGPVPMLGIFGGDDLTPTANHEGRFPRAGTSHWASSSRDSAAEAPAGLEGHWVETGTLRLADGWWGASGGRDGAVRVMVGMGRA